MHINQVNTLAISLSHFVVDALFRKRDNKKLLNNHYYKISAPCMLALLGVCICGFYV